MDDSKFQIFDKENSKTAVISINVAEFYDQRATL